MTTLHGITGSHDATLHYLGVARRADVDTVTITAACAHGAMLGLLRSASDPGNTVLALPTAGYRLTVARLHA